jgi:hypothetical protein
MPDEFAKIDASATWRFSVAPMMDWADPVEK